LNKRNVFFSPGNNLLLSSCSKNIGMQPENLLPFTFSSNNTAGPCPRATSMKSRHLQINESPFFFILASCPFFQDQAAFSTER